MDNLNIKQQLVAHLNNSNHTITRGKGVVKTISRRGTKVVSVSDRYRAVEFKTFALEVIDNTPYEIKDYSVTLGNVQQLTLYFGEITIAGIIYDKILSVTSSSNKAVALSLAYGLKDKRNGLFILPLDTKNKTFLFRKKHIEKKEGEDISNAMINFINTSYEDSIKAITVGMIELELKSDIYINQIYAALDNKAYIIDHFLKSARNFYKDKSFRIDNNNVPNISIPRLDAYSILLNMKRYTDTVGLKRYSQQFYDIVNDIV